MPLSASCAVQECSPTLAINSAANAKQAGTAMRLGYLSAKCAQLVDTAVKLATIMSPTVSHVVLVVMVAQVKHKFNAGALARMDDMQLQQQQPDPTLATASHAMLVDTVDMEAPLASAPATVPQGDTRQRRLQLDLMHRTVRRVTQGSTVLVEALPASARVIVRQAAMR